MRGGSRIPRRRGRQPTILPKKFLKMHEIAKILGRGVARAGIAPLRSATGFNVRSNCVVRLLFHGLTLIVISKSPNHDVLADKTPELQTAK